MWPFYSRHLINPIGLNVAWYNYHGLITCTHNHPFVVSIYFLIYQIKDLNKIIVNMSNFEMGARSFDDEIAQVPSRDRADLYFVPNISTSVNCIYMGLKWCSGSTLASHLLGRRFKPWTICGKVGSCLLIIVSLQYRTSTATVCTGFLRPQNYPS